MKKIRLTLFGMALFVAGSAYTQKQAKYVAHQSKAFGTDSAEITQVRPQLQHTVAYQLINKQ